MNWQDILKLFPNPGEGWKQSSYRHGKDPSHKDGSDTFTEGNLQILATDHYKARFEQRGGKRQGQMLRDKLLQLSPNSDGWAFVSPDQTPIITLIGLEVKRLQVYQKEKCYLSGIMMSKGYREQNGNFLEEKDKADQPIPLPQDLLLKVKEEAVMLEDPVNLNNNTGEE